MTAILSTDILSNFKKMVYGKKGDKVTIVADHLNVMIVEDKNGKRFPVSVEKLMDFTITNILSGKPKNSHGLAKE